MTILNSALRALLDLLLKPFEGLSPWWGLIFLSLLSAVGALLVYKKVSNQDAIERVKRKMHASLFEIRLFNDDLRAIVRAQSAFLLANLRYLGLNLVPLLWLLIPFVLVFLHLEPRYRLEGFAPGETAVVKARQAGDEDDLAGPAAKPAWSLEAPAGLRVTSPGVWNTARREMAWRVTADAPGYFEVGIREGSEVWTKELRFSDRSEVFSPERPAVGFVAQLEDPAEKPLVSAIAGISVLYPERDWGHVALTDIPIAWWFWWLVLMVLFGLTLRGPMGVQI